MKRYAIWALAWILIASLSFGMSSAGGVPENEEKATRSLNMHSPIMIEGNSGFTSANGVIGGSGIVDDPYVIEGWDIDGGVKGYGISISNTTSHVIVRDCHVHGANGVGNINIVNSYGKGIVLNNVINCVISGNSFNDNLMSDIHLYHSKANMIVDNECNSLDAASNIILQWSDNNMIDANTADPYGRENDPVNGTVTTQYGIFVLYDSVDNLITDNIVSNHTNDGIAIMNNGCERTTIRRNVISFNQRGISVSGEGHVIKDNMVHHNENTGIYADMLYKGKIQKNRICSNEGSGVIVNYDGGNQAEGMNLVDHNIIVDNGKEGIKANGKDSTYRNNTVTGNAGNGFTIWKHDNNEVYWNNVTDNGGHGAMIKLHWQLSSTQNTIRMNNFIDNALSYQPLQVAQGMDESSGNRWNGSSKGNYWSDHTTPDNDSDGIVDTPYIVNSTNGIADRRPVTTPFGITVIGPTIPPRITTKDVTSVKVNETYDVTYAAYDPLLKAAKLTWKIWTNASWLSISGTRISGIPGEDDVGSYIVNVSVNDEDELTRRSFVLTVIPLDDNGTEPEEPGNDTEPEDPGNGTEPEEPGNDTEPGEPGNGTEPGEEPGNDTEPGEPGNGTEPGEEPGDGTVVWNEITNEPPSMASIKLPDGSLKAGKSFTLSAYSIDPDLARGDVLSFDWYIEGMGHVGTGETIELVLPEGTYQIRLKVTDHFGLTKEVSQHIYVEGDQESHTGFIPIMLIMLATIILVAIVLGTFIYRRRRTEGDGGSDISSDECHFEDAPININGPPGDVRVITSGSLDPPGRAFPSGLTMGFGQTASVPVLSDSEARMIEGHMEDALTTKRISVGHRKKTLRNMLERRKDSLDMVSYMEIKAILDDE
ncbi:MAG: right-handed parallel beta-helix repeat-containing protein [Candidatus Thermoplasmatota archaeon]|nr:right-handed parallel beta-helix repeat-containing protein [Candidatus Thermoplasmatota archaeon]